MLQWARHSARPLSPVGPLPQIQGSSICHAAPWSPHFIPLSFLNQPQFSQLILSAMPSLIPPSSSLPLPLYPLYSSFVAFVQSVYLSNWDYLINICFLDSRRHETDYTRSAHYFILLLYIAHSGLKKYKLNKWALLSLQQVFKPFLWKSTDSFLVSMN
jgi:hypothetical protein